MCKVISICNQKGGTAKTATAVNLGIGLARKGKRVCLIDCDPQGSLSVYLGIPEPDELEESLATVMKHIIQGDEYDLDEAMYQHSEGVDFIPGNIELSALELSLVTLMSREYVLKEFVDRLRERYDYLILDSMPSLGMLTINVLSCADSVLIPVESKYLSIKGLQQLIRSMGQIKRKINPELEFEGIVLTMVDNRTNDAKDTIEKLEENYGEYIHIFNNRIPLTVRMAETTKLSKSIYAHDPCGKAAAAYEGLTEEVLANGK